MKMGGLRENFFENEIEIIICNRKGNGTKKKKKGVTCEVVKPLR